MQISMACFLSTSPLEGEAVNVLALPGGGSSAQRFENTQHHPLGVGERVIIPKADHAVASHAQPVGSRIVLFRMLPPSRGEALAFREGGA